MSLRSLTTWVSYSEESIEFVRSTVSWGLGWADASALSGGGEPGDAGALHYRLPGIWTLLLSVGQGAWRHTRLGTDQWQKWEPKAGGSLIIYNLCMGRSLYGSLVGAVGSVSVPAGSEIRRDPPFFCPWDWYILSSLAKLPESLTGQQIMSFSVIAMRDCGCRSFIRIKQTWNGLLGEPIKFTASSNVFYKYEI